MRVLQDTKILQQLLSTQKDGQGGNITLNFIENIVVGDDAVIGDSDNATLPSPRKSRCALPRSETSPKQLQYLPEISEDARRELRDFIERLPGPRIDTLMYWIFRVCADTGMTRQDTADWLGMSFATASRWFKRFNLNPKKGERK